MFAPGLLHAVRHAIDDRCEQPEQQSGADDEAGNDREQLFGRQRLDAPGDQAGDEIAERRVVERRVRSAQPAWKLFTTGSVGGQVLLGLPALNRLRRDSRLDGRVAVWPFETGLDSGDASIVIAEIYPSLLDAAVATRSRQGEVKDAAQVRVTAAAYAALDAEGKLRPLFGGAPGLTAAEHEIIEREEAWILGAGFEDALRSAA